MVGVVVVVVVVMVVVVVVVPVAVAVAVVDLFVCLFVCLFVWGEERSRPKNTPADLLYFTAHYDYDQSAPPNPWSKRNKETSTNP